jgi:hypothetical protein
MKLLFENWRKFVFESKLAWYGSTQDFEDFDLSRTTEFGYHFGLDQEQSKHRIKDEGFLFHVELDYENPLDMPDVLRWTLESVLRELRIPPEEIADYKKEASSRARDSGRSMRVEENLILAEILSDMDYDAIEYENRGEGGGKAVIVWDPALITITRKEELN